MTARLNIDPTYQARAARLVEELQFAVTAVDRRDLANWSVDVGVMTGKVFVRRCKRLATTANTVAGWLWDEGSAIWGAAWGGRLQEHATQRGQALTQTLSDFSDRTADQLAVLRSMTDNPEQLARLAVGTVFAFASSGGIDADGGIPDLDLELGIGFHRSIFTHSIISGSVVEALFYALATLTAIAYQHLPTEHDPFWDLVERHREQFVTAAVAGSSAGIAYHLFVDGAIQHGAYHDLPWSMPQEGHDAILEANSAAEALDVTEKRKTYRR
jgi:hypothetical protein